MSMGRAPAIRSGRRRNRSEAVRRTGRGRYRRGSPGDDTAGRARRPPERPACDEDAGSLQSGDASTRPGGPDRAGDARAPQRHHGRCRRDRRPHDPHPRRWAAGRRRGTGPDRRHRHLPARIADWREPVFAGCHRLNGNGELTGLEWVRESGMLTDPGRDHEHAQRRRGPRRARRGVGHGRRCHVVAARGRRDVRRAAQRHQRLPRSCGAPARGARRRGRRPGRRRHGRWRDRDDLPRVQGRDRDGVARHRRGSRRLHGRCPRPGELRQARLAADRWRARRRGDPDLRGAEPVRAGRPAALRATAGLRFDHRGRRHGCAAPPPPVRAAGPAGRSRHRPRRRHGGHTSGDLFIAFATGNRLPSAVDDEHPSGLGTYEVRAVGDIVIDRLFDATIEATEEAIVNALVAATTVVGRDGITAHALPHDRLREVMAAHGRARPRAHLTRRSGAGRPRRRRTCALTARPDGRPASRSARRSGCRTRSTSRRSCGPARSRAARAARTSCGDDRSPMRQ